MNKRLLCLLLSLVMLFSVVLTGCGNKTDDEALSDISEEAAKNTLTLSMYLMSETKVSADQEKRIEDEVNKITKSRFKIQLDIRYFTEEDYYTELEKAFQKTEDEEEARKAAEKALKEAIKRGEVTAPPATKEPVVTEEATIINDLGIPELAYPTIPDYQVDIFYIGGYDRFVNYKKNNWMAPLDDALSSDAEIVLDHVATEYLERIESVGGGTYMIPTNVPAGQYTYMLLNKDVLAKYNYFNTDDFKNLVSEPVQDILKHVSLYDREEYVPLYSATGELDLDKISFLGLDENFNYSHGFSVMGGVYYDSWTLTGRNQYYDFHNIFGCASFKNQMTTLLEYKNNGYYAVEGEEEKPFAVGYVKGDAAYAEQFKDQYEVVVVGKPKMSTDELFANGIAVSSSSSSSARAMDIVSYLNTNVDFRNLILYGIEGENYELVDSDIINEVSGTPYKLVNRLNDSYMMDVNKTGNIIHAYPMVGELPNIREFQKVHNIDTTPMLDIGFALSDYAELTPINYQQMDELRIFSEQIYEEMMACESTEELLEFFSEANDRVAKNPAFVVMTNLEYSQFSMSYDPDLYGDGAAFAYIYKDYLGGRMVLD